MTDNEIIKAFKDFLNEQVDGYTDLVEIGGERYEFIEKQLELLKKTDNLINRQKAEIKKLREENKIISRYEDYIKVEAYKEFADKVCDEITDAIINNGKVINERIEKHNVNRLEDNFCCMCDGKIRALGGIEYFIKNLLKELVENENEKI